MAKRTKKAESVEVEEVEESQETKALSKQDAQDYVREGVVEVDVADALQAEEVQDALDKVLSAKQEAFEAMAPDFWKPGASDKAGRPYPKKVKGIYLGWQRGNGKLIQHALGVKDEKGRPMALRFNGTATLTRELKKIPRKEWGTLAAGISIEFLGQDPGTGERAGIKHFDVLRLKA